MSPTLGYAVVCSVQILLCHINIGENFHRTWICSTNGNTSFGLSCTKIKGICEKVVIIGEHYFISLLGSQVLMCIPGNFGLYDLKIDLILTGFYSPGY